MLSTASQILILVRILVSTLAQNNFPNKYWEKNVLKVNAMSSTLKKTDKNKDIQKVYFIVIINIIIIIIITTIIIITIILSCLFFFWASKVFVHWTSEMNRIFFGPAQCV